MSEQKTPQPDCNKLTISYEDGKVKLSFEGTAEHLWRFVQKRGFPILLGASALLTTGFSIWSAQTKPSPESPPQIAQCDRESQR